MIIQNSTVVSWILGGGIVGSALAYFLSARITPSQITLIDPSASSGSTTIAPGLIGQLNSISHLTTAAKETVETYSKIPGGFHRVGGLEIASTREGIAQLHSRLELARASGLEARILNSKETADIAPDFHAQDEKSTGLLFPSDGTAEPTTIVKHFQERAVASGVSIDHGEVIDISIGTNGGFLLSTRAEVLKTDKIIIATGIWTPAVMEKLGIQLSIIPVAHPYAHGPSHEYRQEQQPFVRWPERHVYARDHGENDGFGSYDHAPRPCVPRDSALEDIVPSS